MKSMKSIIGVTLSALTIAGCSAPTSQVVSADCATTVPDNHDMVILASATRNETIPTLSANDETKLRKLAENKGSAVYIFDLASGSPTCHDLTPMRGTKVENSEAARVRKINDNITAIKGTLFELQNPTSKFDLLDLLSQVSKVTDKSTNLTVLSSGVSTDGGMDLRTLGWAVNPESLVSDLQTKQLIPSLKDWNVTFSGLGIVANDQKELYAPQRIALSAYWESICHAGLAVVCDVDDQPRDYKQSRTPAIIPPVFVPEITSFKGPNSVTTSIPTDVLGFTADSAALSSRSDELLQPIVNRGLKEGSNLIIRGFSVKIRGGSNSSKLSLKRAQAVADKLNELGFPRSRIVDVIGEPPVDGAYVNGKFNEAKASSLRRVEITQLIS